MWRETWARRAFTHSCPCGFKKFGDWTSFAGLGYWINPGYGNRNFWYFGLAVQRQITDKLAVGGEIFNQTGDEVLINTGSVQAR